MSKKQNEFLFMMYQGELKDDWSGVIEIFNNAHAITIRRFAIAEGKHVDNIFAETLTFDSNDEEFVELISTFMRKRYNEICQEMTK